MDAKIVIFAIFTTLFQGMRIVVQRVKRASVTIDGKVHSSIGKGLLVLAGFEDADTAEDINWMAAKMVNLRLFDDSIGVMNLSAVETGSGIMIVSQFTLHASTKRETGLHISVLPDRKRQYRFMKSSFYVQPAFLAELRPQGSSVQ